MDVMAAGTEPEVVDETKNHKREKDLDATKKKQHSKRSRSSKSKKRTARSKNITIKNGDTLSEIAERHHTTVSKLRKLNGIKGNSIRAGKKIKVK